LREYPPVHWAVTDHSVTAEMAILGCHGVDRDSQDKR
jgi:hypothetical protein